MTNLERRWIVAIMEGFAPVNTRVGLAPREGEIDWLDACERMRLASNSMARLGLRIATLIAVFAPIWMGMRLCTIAALRPDERAVVIDRLLLHRVFFVRELTMLLKIGASFGLLGAARLRAASNYDLLPAPSQDEGSDKASSGVKPKALPVFVAGAVVAKEVA